MTSKFGFEPPEIEENRRNALNELLQKEAARINPIILEILKDYKDTLQLKYEITSNIEKKTLSYLYFGEWILGGRHMGDYEGPSGINVLLIRDGGNVVSLSVDVVGCFPQTHVLHKVIVEKSGYKSDDPSMHVARFSADEFMEKFGAP